MSRKLKAYPHTLYDLDIEYYTANRIQRVDGKKGYIYGLCKPLTPEQADALKRYSNVEIRGITYRHAPEIKRQAIVLFDNCL